MNKYIYFLFLLLASTLTQADNKISNNQFEGVFIGCLTLDSSSKKLQCLNNIHTLIKDKINTNVNYLNKRDRVYYLNTKALELKINQNKCHNSSTSSISIKKCSINYDLMALNYLSERYSND